MTVLHPATIKGNPWKTHLLPEGSRIAICGHQPGYDSKYSQFKSRAGWYRYTVRISPGRPICIKCEAAEQDWIEKNAS